MKFFSKLFGIFLFLYAMIIIKRNMNKIINLIRNKLNMNKINRNKLKINKNKNLNLIVC